MRERWGFVFQGKSATLTMLFEWAEDLGLLNDKSVFANS